MANVKYVVDLSEEEEQQLRKFISRGKVVELGFAESICHEIVRQILKKRPQALATAPVVYPGGKC